MASGSPSPPITVTGSEEGRESPVDVSSTSEAGGSRATGSPPAAPRDPRLLERCNCEELRHVHCHLETKDLWDKFNELGTEMIITKTGRYVSV